MTDSLRLWGRATSVNVQKVAWVVAELTLKCERIDAGGKFGGLTDPAFIQMNPNKRVPTLMDGELILWESNAICRYLADAYGQPNTLKSESIGERAQADMWMEWFQSNVYAHFITVFYQAVRLPPSQRNPDKKATALDALCSSLKIFDAQLAHQRFICGDHLTLGDIPTGSCLYRFFTLDINRPALPNLERYYRGLQKRQAYHDHVMIDFSSLAGID
ncbi:MAG: glutathione S-transferase N-terminal domain-containing protein [Roseobacter sp.]